MSTNAGSLKDQISRTEERFQTRRANRKAAERSLKKGDMIEANSEEAVRHRMSRLGLPQEMADKTRARSFQIPAAQPAEMVPRAAINSIALERILGRSDLMPVSYLLLGQHRARSVGRIHIRNQNGQRVGFGTGFLVSPRLLLTNNHVLKNERDASFSEVEFDFEVDLAGNVRQTVTFRLDPATFFITDVDLDFALVAVSPNRDRGREPRDWGWNRLAEGEGLIVKGESVSIIQHPNGEAKQIALRENQVIDLLDSFAHYHTDTAPGSSGSPVFNDQWEVVALHHSGVPERDAEGNVLAVDGRKWEEWMGDHRIKWIANEGVSGTKIVDFVKSHGLAGEQSILRDEMLNTTPPLPEGVNLIVPPRVDGEQTTTVISPGRATDAVSAPPSMENGVTWTIPLRITVNLGQPDLASSKSLVGTEPDRLMPSRPSDSEPAEFRQALAELEEGRTREYYNAETDEADREDYYKHINADDFSQTEMFEKLGALLKETHRDRPSYKPSTHVYPWVDLHPDRKLRSIYSGKTFEPAEFIREDFRIEQDRVKATEDLLRNERALGPEALREQLDLLESQHPFNCEHVVPQSWFKKKEPMRGDLHHLFACESGCNSFRGNIPYFDFSDFEEVVRTACGKREENKFEPSAGKGTVARATLYFLLRYPKQVGDVATELHSDRIGTLLQWHADFPVEEYELHRNQAIFQKQGNRNPLTDHPEWAGRIGFALGFS